MKNLKGIDLIFISRIKRDGSGVVAIEKDEELFNYNEKYIVHSLSISNKTYIACGFNSYVVKLK